MNKQRKTESTIFIRSIVLVVKRKNRKSECRKSGAEYIILSIDYT